MQNKYKDTTSWKKYWDSIDMKLYAKIIINKKKGSSCLRFNEKQLAKILKYRYDLENKNI